MPEVQFKIQFYWQIVFRLLSQNLHTLHPERPSPTPYIPPKGGTHSLPSCWVFAILGNGLASTSALLQVLGVQTSLVAEIRDQILYPCSLIPGRPFGGLGDLAGALLGKQGDASRDYLSLSGWRGGPRGGEHNLSAIFEATAHAIFLDHLRRL